MPVVFDIELDHPVSQTIEVETLIFPFGDGLEQRANTNQAWGPRANGEGGLSTYKGINRFQLAMDMQEHVNNDGTARANKHWNFYKARLGGYDPFYFYWHVERTTPDLTGIDQIGRYLVRYEQQNLSRENFAIKLFRSQVALIEVRE